MAYLINTAGLVAACRPNTVGHFLELATRLVFFIFSNILMPTSHIVSIQHPAYYMTSLSDVIYLMKPWNAIWRHLALSNIAVPWLPLFHLRCVHLRYRAVLKHWVSGAASNRATTWRENALFPGAELDTKLPRRRRRKGWENTWKVQYLAFQGTWTSAKDGRNF